MAILSNSISKIAVPMSIKLPQLRPHPSKFRVRAASSSPSSSRDDSLSQQSKKKSFRKKVSRVHRPLITISTSNGRGPGQWTSEYVLTLRELQLADLAGDEQKDAEVFVSLTIHKHASFGFSVDGRIFTSFNRRCSSCFCSYCREIDTSFDVWVLPSSRMRESELPEIGGNDPSVIYVTPGSEADLDSLIRDTLRLTASAKNTCSESCEKRTVVWQYTDGKRSYDQRWSRLLEIKNSI